jgi:hypothetical protein
MYEWYVSTTREATGIGNGLVEAGASVVVEVLEWSKQGLSHTCIRDLSRNQFVCAQGTSWLLSIRMPKWNLEPLGNEQLLIMQGSTHQLRQNVIISKELEKGPRMQTMK